MKMIKKLFNLIVSIQKDSLLHFICGMIISQLVTAIINVCYHPFYGGCIIGVIVGFIAGIVKEIYDSNHEGHSVEAKDFLFTTIGAIVGAVFMLSSVI